MGEVWKARDSGLGRIVAIKRMNERHSVRFDAGDRVRNQEVLQILSGQPGKAYGMAAYHSVICDADAMFVALDEAYQQRDWNLRMVATFANYDPYRAAPRFPALLAKMNLA